MHIAKIVILLCSTLLVMRLGSWGVLWLLCHVFGKGGLWIRIAANGTALGIFLLLLLVDRLPGEAIDERAAWFGISVFALLALSDAKWIPKWFVRRRSS